MPKRLMQRILELPEPHRGRFAVWLADYCGLGINLLDAPDEKLAAVEGLLRAAERAFGRDPAATAPLGGTRLLYIARSANHASMPLWSVIEQGIYGKPGIETLRTRPLAQELTLAQARDYALMMLDLQKEQA